ncbi:hemolysin III family protein [Nocardioidaceae bacterium]|nr:hemolysin III family protein [Nocardioidaceae bacterium]
MRDRVADAVSDALDEVKPHLRGWLHLATAPLTLAAGIVLFVLSPTTATRIGSAIFVLTALVLFTVSAVYHRGTWSPRTWGVLRRFDHANIFLLIAGSYTPFTLILLDGAARTTLLSIVWAGALAGVAFRVFWPHAPRWLYVPIYIALGWAAVFFLPAFLAADSPVVLWLIVAGGLCYTVGGIVYGLKKPDPSPAWFGFHEVFHALTIAGFVVHYVGVSIATYQQR